VLLGTPADIVEQVKRPAMRIWTLHPSYLDAKGLVAVWREALLAQRVLSGATTGYRRHPQLTRFKQVADPMGAIATYLYHIYEEAGNRGYTFDRQKIASPHSAEPIPTTHGQLLYEWEHLKAKLHSRAPEKYQSIAAVQEPTPHPLFTIIAGPVEAWEITRYITISKRL
jgi:hypothetical protein